MSSAIDSARPFAPDGRMTVRTTTQLRRLVTRPEIAFLMEAHDGLSARIVEETGYGNFNNMRRRVLKLEQVSVGGVVIEHQLFPKTSSVLRSELQPLADIA